MRQSIRRACRRVTSASSSSRPRVRRLGWALYAQLREEVYITKGAYHCMWSNDDSRREQVRDYILYYKPNIAIAIIEAKDNTHWLARVFNDITAGSLVALGPA